MIEQEYKFMQSGTAFARQMDSIRRYYPAAAQTETMHVNYYYDTPDGALNKENITLRIRQKEQTLAGKVKWHHGQQKPEQGGFISSEYSFICECLPQIIDYEGKLAVLQGVLITKRSSFLIVPGVKMDFDRNYYWGICDYEVEIEFDDNKGSIAADLVKRFGLSMPSPKSKSARFFETKQTMDLCMQIGAR